MEVDLALPLPQQSRLFCIFYILVNINLLMLNSIVNAIGHAGFFLKNRHDNLFY